MADIDELQIRIGSTASDAQQSITALTGKLKDLAQACNGGCGLQSVVNGLRAIKGAVNAIDNSTGDKLISLADGLKSLKGVGKFSVAPELATSLTMINATISSMSADVGTKLQGFAGGLASLGQVGKVSISSTLGRHLMEIAQAGEYFEQHAAGMGSMTNALAALGQVSKVSVSSSLAGHLVEITNALYDLSTVDATEIATIASSLGGFNVKITASTVKNLEALGKAAETLVGRDFTGLQRLNVELTKMSVSLPQIAQNIPALNAALGQLDQNMERTARSANKAESSYTNLYAAFQLARHAVASAARTIAQWIDKSNSYIENVNLFTAAMGDYAESAKEYAEKVGELMGIDPGAWMRNQGVFQTLSTGFGVSAERAAIMSKNLTQLGYDLSSFFNIAVEGEGGAMQKLQAGLAGELEPLRRLGFDLSEARLKAVALSLGIDKTYKSMNQAEKAQLRYYAILNQVTIAQGDMARTLNSPANQLRIFKAQVEQAARALGNIFIPLLNAVLPYLIAAAKFIRILASSIASLFGFEMPEVDYSGISTAATASEELDKGLGKSAKSAKKLNELLADWDELNIIASENSNSGSGSGAGSTGSDGFNFKLPEYNFLGGLVESNIAKIMETLKPVIDWIQEHTQAVLDIVTLIGIGFLAWKINKALTGDLGNLIKFALGLGLVIWGAKMAYEDFMDQWNNGIDVDNMIALIKDIGIIVIGLGLMFGVTGIGIGLLVGGIILAINPIKEFLETGELTEDALNQLTIAALVLAAGITVLATHSVKAGIGVAIALYGVFQAIKDVKDQWDNGVTFENMKNLLKDVGIIALGLFVAFGKVGLGVGLIIGGVLAAIAPIKEFIETGELTEEAFWQLEAAIGAVGVGIGLLTGSWIPVAIAAVADLVLWAVNDWEGFKATIENIWNQIKAWWEKVVQPILDKFAWWLFDNVIHPVIQWVTDVWNAIVDIWGKISDWYYKNVGKPLADAALWVVTSVMNLWDGLINFFTVDVPGAFAIALSILESTFITPCVEAWETTKTACTDAWNSVITYFSETLPSQMKVAWEVFDRIILAPMRNAWEGIKQGCIDAWNWVIKFFVETLPSWISTAWNVVDIMAIQPIRDVWNDISTTCEEAWTAVGEFFEQAAVDLSTIALDIYLGVSDWFKTLGDSIKTFMKDPVAAIKAAWRGLVSFFKAHVIQPLVDKFNELKDKVLGIFQAIADFWNNTIAPLLGISASENWKTPVSGRGYVGYAPGDGAGAGAGKWGFVSLHAEGGFPTTGEMFVARESGPELVGTIGNRTAVVNNDQIENGIAEGVREANSEQNSLLQMANQYLRIIAAKSNKYQFEPSVGLAQTVKRSEEMRLMAEGV